MGAGGVLPQAGSMKKGHKFCSSSSPGQSKDEVAGTLEAVQQLQGAAQHLPKAKEASHSRCQELERLRREGASQKEMDKVRGGPVLQPSSWGGSCRGQWP